MAFGSALAVITCGVAAVLIVPGNVCGAARRGVATRPDVGAIVSLVREEPLGHTWSELPAREREPAEPFHGVGFGILAPDYYVYRWTGPFQQGSLERAAYLMDTSSVPTLEHVVWTYPWPADTLSSVPDSLWADLTRRFDATFREIPQAGVARGSAYWAGSRSYEGPHGIVRLNLTARRHRIMGPVLRLEYTSTRLSKLEPPWKGHGPIVEAAEGIPADSLEIPTAIAALGPAQKRLAALLSRAGSPADTPAVIEALESSGQDGGEKDLVLWSVHLWLRSIGEATRDSMWQSGSLRELGDGWNACRKDSVVYRLAARVGENAWTDAAFLELMRDGWGCYGGGGEEVPDQSWTDESAPVIERGEWYLRTYTTSTIATEVAWCVARAHETAWTLILSSSPYADESTLARTHRDRAISLYERLIRNEPWNERTRAATQRLHRMRLNVETDYRLYSDFLD